MCPCNSCTSRWSRVQRAQIQPKQEADLAITVPDCLALHTQLNVIHWRNLLSHLKRSRSLLLCYIVAERMSERAEDDVRGEQQQQQQRRAARQLKQRGEASTAMATVAERRSLPSPEIMLGQPWSNWVDAVKLYGSDGEFDRPPSAIAFKRQPRQIASFRPIACSFEILRNAAGTERV